MKFLLPFAFLLSAIVAADLTSRTDSDPSYDELCCDDNSYASLYDAYEAESLPRMVTVYKTSPCLYEDHFSKDLIRIRSGAIRLAIQQHNLEAFRFLMPTDKMQYRLGQTVLEEAIRHEDLEMVKIVLDIGFLSFPSSLDVAIEVNNVEILDCLLADQRFIHNSYPSLEAAIIKDTIKFPVFKHLITKVGLSFEKRQILNLMALLIKKDLVQHFRILWPLLDRNTIKLQSQNLIHMCVLHNASLILDFALSQSSIKLH
jgi:hypothetical protein